MVLDSEMFCEIVAIFAGIIFCIFPSHWIVPPILKLVDDPKKIPPPKGVDPNNWMEAMMVPNKRAGGMLGFLERIIVFVAMVANAHIVIAGWLTFKVATKWEVWGNIIQVPDKLDGTDEISYLSARRKLGSSVFMRFLLGTLSNVLLGMIAFGLTWTILRLWPIQ